MSGFPIVQAGAIPNTSEVRSKNSAIPQLKDTHLQSAQAIIGYQIQSGEEVIGQVVDFLMDSESWVIDGLVVSLGNRFTGKKVLLTPAQVQRISYEDSKVFADVSKEALELAPGYEEKSTPVNPVIL